MRKFIIEMLVLTIIMVIATIVGEVSCLMVEKHGWFVNFKYTSDLMFFWGGMLYLKFCQWYEAY